MSWESLETYKKLVEAHPELNEQAQQKAFTKFLDRMWTRPDTYAAFAKAYMEFTTSHNLNFPKLDKIVEGQNNETQRKNTRRSRRRRSRRKRKSVTA